MNRLLQSLVGLAVIALLAGCTSMAPVAAPLMSSLGRPPSQMLSQTSVNLSEGNFVLVKTNVVGSSKGFNLLGLIPIYSPRLTRAMGRMYARSGIRLGSSQTMAHLLIEHSSTYWILFSIPKTTVRADIVQFNPEIGPGCGTNKASVVSP